MHSETWVLRSLLYLDELAADRSLLTPVQRSDSVQSHCVVRGLWSHDSGTIPRGFVCFVVIM